MAETPDRRLSHGRVRATQLAAPPGQTTWSPPRLGAAISTPRGVRHPLNGYDLSTGRLYGYSRSRRPAPNSRASIRCLRSCTRPSCGSRPLGQREAAGNTPTSPPGPRMGRRQHARARSALRLEAPPGRGPVHLSAVSCPRRHGHNSHRAGGPDPPLPRPVRMSTSVTMINEPSKLPRRRGTSNSHVTDPRLLKLVNEPP